MGEHGPNMVIHVCDEAKKCKSYTSRILLCAQYLCTGQVSRIYIDIDVVTLMAICMCTSVCVHCTEHVCAYLFHLCL